MFLIFSVPTSWHRFLAFGRVVPPGLTPDSVNKYYLSSQVLPGPMGFCNSVSLAQHIHRNIVGEPEREGRLNTGRTGASLGVTHLSMFTSITLTSWRRWTWQHRDRSEAALRPWWRRSGEHIVDCRCLGALGRQWRERRPLRSKAPRLMA